MCCSHYRWTASSCLSEYGHLSIQRTEEEFRAEPSEFNAEISNPQRRAHDESDVFIRELGSRIRTARSAKTRAFESGRSPTSSQSAALQ